MDPLVGAGASIAVIANLIEFTTILAKVIHRTSEYCDKVDYAPKVVRDIDAKLGLLRITVERAVQRASDRTRSVTDAYTADDLAQIQRVANGCGAAITDSLLPLLNKLLPTAADSKLRRMRRAVGSVKNEDELKRTWDRIEGYVKILSSYFVVINNPPVNLPSPSKKPGPRFMYPRRLVHNYVERSLGGEQLLDSVARHLSNQRDRPSVAVLLGMGGVGKTQLALRYCQNAMDGGQSRTLVWINASSSSTAIKSFQDFAREISPGAELGDSSRPSIGLKDSASNAVQEDIRVVLHYLEENGPWVTVFDNYDRPDEFEPHPNLKSIGDCWPAKGPGQVLITSRSQDCDRLGKVFEIGRLSEKDGGQLLHSLISSDSNGEPDSSVDEVVRKLGCLALAIDQAGAYIRSQRISAHAFLEHYQKRREVVLSCIPKTRDWEYQHVPANSNDQTMPFSVFTTWEL